MKLMFNDILIYVTLFFSLFSTLFFLVVYIEEGRKVKKKKVKRYPKISIIMPAYNESKNIIKSIKSAKSVDYPKNKLEIIVVDDKSEDNTYEQAKKMQGKLVKVFTKKHGGKARAVNYGIKKSSGEIIMVLDADTFPDKKCLKNIVGYFEDPEIMAALPVIKIWKPKNIIEKCQTVEYSTMGLLKKTFFTMGSMNCTPAGAFVRKSFLKKYGGFATNTLTEDFEMGMRIQSKNYQVAQSLDSQVYTVVPSKIKKLIRQRVRWSYGGLENIKKYRHMLSPKYGDLGLFFLPMMLFSMGLVSFLFIYYMIQVVSDLFHILYLNSLINFDVIPLIDISGKMATSSIITNEKSFIILFTILSAIIIYNLGRKRINEKFRFSYIIYFLIYGWIMSFSQLIALSYFLVGKKPRW